MGLSLCTFILMVTYASYRSVVLLSLNDFKIMQAKEENYFGIFPGFSN